MNDNLLLANFARSVLSDLGIKPTPITQKLMVYSILNNIPFKKLWNEYNSIHKDHLNIPTEEILISLINN